MRLKEAQRVFAVLRRSLHDRGDGKLIATSLATAYERRHVVPVLGSKMHKLGESKGRAAARSLTPTGFARAWFEANP